MEDKKYLNEEKYQKVVKKLSKISIIILILGLLIGGGLIAYGFFKSNEKTTPAVVKEEEKSEEDIKAEIQALENEIAPLEAKKAEEFTQNGFSEEYYRLSNQIEEKDIKLGSLRVGSFEDSKVFEDFKKESDSIVKKVKYSPFYMIGGFIIFASFVVSFMVFLFSKRREISAFSVQQSMPVAKEGLEKIAPSLGEVGKEIAKGIKEGTKEE